MKKIFLFLFSLFTICSLAQKKIDIKEFFWGKNDQFKSVTSIPDKWKNESAVIIYKYKYYNPPKLNHYRLKAVGSVCG